MPSMLKVNDRSVKIGGGRGRLPLRFVEFQLLRRCAEQPIVDVVLSNNSVNANELTDS